LVVIGSIYFSDSTDLYENHKKYCILSLNRIMDNIFLKVL